MQTPPNTSSVLATVDVVHAPLTANASPTKTQEVYRVHTTLQPTSLGLLIVGVAGNNGTTLAGSILAHKHNLSWSSRRGKHTPDFLGSVLMGGSLEVGEDQHGKGVHAPIADVVPLVSPSSILLGGWDVRTLSMKEGAEQAGVFEPTLLRELEPHWDEVGLRSGILFEEGGATARTLVEGAAPGCTPPSRREAYQRIRSDIREFRQTTGVEQVIVLWSASTEGPNKEFGTEAGLHQAVRENDPAVSPSQVYALASLHEGCSFINGGAQRTVGPAITEAAAKRCLFAVGNDWKSGQTKMRSSLLPYFTGAGMRVTSVVSYNHLGNHDGVVVGDMAAAPFESKRRSKAGVLSQAVESNPQLYAGTRHSTEGIDNKVVIQHVADVRDTKKAMDEWNMDIFMGGRQSLVTHCTCEDSLLAVPLALDQILFVELLSRVHVWESAPHVATLGMDPMRALQLHPSAPMLSYYSKSPAHGSDDIAMEHDVTKQRGQLCDFLRFIRGWPLHGLLRTKAMFCEVRQDE